LELDSILLSWLLIKSKLLLNTMMMSNTFGKVVLLMNLRLSRILEETHWEEELRLSYI